MDFFRGLTLNCAVQYATMIYFLLATIVCSVIFILTRYTNINVLEKDTMFTRSPHMTKVEPITMVSEQPPKDCNSVEVNGKGEHEKNGFPKTDAVLLLNEIMTRATKNATNGLQNEFKQQKS